MKIDLETFKERLKKSLDRYDRHISLDSIKLRCEREILIDRLFNKLLFSEDKEAYRYFKIVSNGKALYGYVMKSALGHDGIIRYNSGVRYYLGHDNYKLKVTYLDPVEQTIKYETFSLDSITSIEVCKKHDFDTLVGMFSTFGYE
ncbi:gp52 [Sphingomonas phage PAU]|uniref:gp52 n=1 Tax=Sphingomonas phage PAU TaxID=1150991 RepID=UPI0002573139|nr:gp52 [Sphingomonas phage PAU]AFF28050.1 gp52 [Sphingomonas phage PAU]